MFDFRKFSHNPPKSWFILGKSRIMIILLNAKKCKLYLPYFFNYVNRAKYYKFLNYLYTTKTNLYMTTKINWL